VPRHDGVTTATTTDSDPTASASSSTSATTPASETPTAPSVGVEDLVLRGDGLGPYDFGQDAEIVLAGLSMTLGSPSLDSGWHVPVDGDEWGLWPGCGERVGPVRLVSWDEHDLVVLASGWSDSPDAPPGGGRFFAGWDLSWDGGALPRMRTAEGVTPGMTVQQWVDVYRERMQVSAAPDEAVGLHWFSIDEPVATPMARRGPMRGFITPPAGEVLSSPPPGDTVLRGVRAGMDCESP
jgi:hypothetical protein